MDVKQQEDDQVGATPLSWNSQPAVEAALQEARRSAYAPFQPAVQAAKDYTMQRMNQAHGMVSQPWHSQAGIGTAMPEAAQTAIVANPMHPSFQEIVQWDPRFAQTLMRAKPSIEYAQKPARLFDRGRGPIEGITHGLSPQNMPPVEAAVAKGQGARSTIPIDPDQLQRLHQANLENPGSTLQQFPDIHNSDRPALISKIHEGLHSLYSGKSGGVSLVPNLSLERGRELMNRVLERANIDRMERLRTAQQYWNDPSHGIIDAIAQYRHGKYGGMGVK